MASNDERRPLLDQNNPSATAPPQYNQHQGMYITSYKLIKDMF